MQGQMMNYPLLVTPFIDRAAELFGGVEIVSRLADGTLHRYTYKEARDRAYRLASALANLGLRRGERVGTLMWNHYAHLEAYFGIPMAGGVFHTLNLRLQPKDIAAIAAHAGDRFVIVDDCLLPLWEQIASHFKPERVIVVGNGDYEALLRSGDVSFKLPQAEENDAVGLCYTSGTTGAPKGVLYSHRALALHSLALALPDTLDLRQSDVLLPIVPMFHVNAWGLPFAAAMVGLKLVLPGPRLDSQSICELLVNERVTLMAGVPTIAMAMLRELDSRSDKPSLQAGMRMLVGGSALPEFVVQGLERYGVRMIQGWGMTETTPVGTISTRRETVTKQGITVPFVEIRAVNGDGICARDGQTMGELQIRSPWVAASYFQNNDESDKWTEDGWFRTGDVATIDSGGCMQITDRTKDLIKSGGEWISSVDLENAVMSYPGVQEAAVIAVPDSKWGERPLAVVVLKDGADVTSDMLRAHLAPRFPKWWLPDEFVFAKEIPRTSTGKFLKMKLRETYQDRGKL